MTTPANKLTVEATIAPIIFASYGNGGMPRAFVPYLADRIIREDWDSRGREYTIMRCCWDWFSGGGVADHTAKKIVAALDA